MTDICILMKQEFCCQCHIKTDGVTGPGQQRNVCVSRLESFTQSRSSIKHPRLGTHWKNFIQTKSNQIRSDQMMDPGTNYIRDKNGILFP